MISTLNNAQSTRSLVKINNTCLFFFHFRRRLIVLAFVFIRSSYWLRILGNRRRGNGTAVKFSVVLKKIRYLMGIGSESFGSLLFLVKIVFSGENGL